MAALFTSLVEGFDSEFGPSRPQQDLTAGPVDPALPPSIEQSRSGSESRSPSGQCDDEFCFQSVQCAYGTRCQAERGSQTMPRAWLRARSCGEIMREGWTLARCQRSFHERAGSGGAVGTSDKRADQIIVGGFESKPIKFSFN